jgi:cyclopropane-fatty-acyl-phospholipid synthase
MNETAFNATFFDPEKKTHQFAADLLAKADIEIGGSRPWDIQFYADGVPEAALARGNLGFGEAYMDGAWDAPALDQFFCKLLAARLPDHIKPAKNLTGLPVLACFLRWPTAA